MRVALGAAGVGLAILTAATATADPPPPDPLLVVPAPAAGAPLPGPATSAAPPSAAQQTTSNALGAFTNLLAGPTGGVLPTQSGPGPNPLASIGLLLPQNFGMPTGDTASPYVLGDNTPSGFDRIDAYQGVHALLHGALGRMPRDQLGQPLPGTAPPPGTAVPPGLVQYFDPAAPAVPPPGPADPSLVLPVPPI